MSSSAESHWSRGRWFLAVVILFAVQVALLMVFSEKVRSAAPKPQRAAVRMLTQPISESEAFARVFAQDATSFVLANDHGFSGRAWLQSQASNYSMPDWNEPERWLELNVVQLGSAFTNFLKDVKDPNGVVAEKVSIPSIETSATEQTDFTSRFAVEGSLRLRNRQPVTLPSWSNSEILRNSDVQIAVDGRGQVVLTRLNSRSGLPAADQKAVSVARNLLFEPVNTGSSATNLRVAQVVFQWATIEPATNAISNFD